MVALVEFPFMATFPGITFHGAIPNRCLSVTNRQLPGHEAQTASGRDAQQSRHDFTSPVDPRLFIDALPPAHVDDPKRPCHWIDGAGVAGRACAYCDLRVAIWFVSRLIRGIHTRSTLHEAYGVGTPPPC